MDSGMDGTGKGMEYQSGKMDLSMMVFGQIIKLMVKEYSIILMVTFMKATGLMTALTDMVSTSMPTATSMRATG